jgi:23S rRNA (uracil1939-C5)-methyltransferase
MIPAAVPGDVVQIETRRDQHDYALGSVLQVRRPAPERRDAPCPYASACGGCDWQHIRYDAQTRFKAEVVASEFRQSLGILLDPSGLVEPAPAEFRYRSRIRLKVRTDGRVGFHHPRSNSFVAVEDCLIAAPPISVAARLGRTLGRNCKELEVVSSQHSEVLIAHQAKPPQPVDRKIAREIVNDGIAGVILRAGGMRELFGQVRIAYEAEPGCTIEADADLFSQVNRAQNLKLVAAVMRSAGISNGMRVLDVFCGTGNFSLPAARRGADIIGLDRDGLAIEAARTNARRMGLESSQFIAMAAVDGARFLARTGYHPEVIILDPPRGGAAAMIEPIRGLRARRLIYVSCNLSTLVRDLRQLMLNGYKMHNVSAFDFFPNTHHIEIVATMLLT